MCQRQASSSLPLRGAADIDDTNLDLAFPGRVEATGIAKVKFDLSHLVLATMRPQWDLLSAELTRRPCDVVLYETAFTGIAPLLAGAADEATSSTPATSEAAQPATSRPTPPTRSSAAKNQPRTRCTLPRAIWMPGKRSSTCAAHSTSSPNEGHGALRDRDDGIRLRTRRLGNGCPGAPRTPAPSRTQIHT